MKEFNSNIEQDGQYKIDFDKEAEVVPTSDTNNDKDIDTGIQKEYINENADDLYGRYARIAEEKKNEKEELKKHPKPPLFQDFDHYK